ncbi:MAG: permease prefix domain 1-containing protein [Desulfosporosinus sp.]|nr:permease prefix domain 1-containing protein [Desulfosporosinus sp.]
MNKIEKYINFICKNSRGSKKEIEDLKQEMRSHLTQTVQELMADGKNEQESVELAISRFGEKNQIQDELANVFRIQKKFGNIMLAVALIFFVAGVSFLIAFRVTENNLLKRGNDLSFQTQMITRAAKTNDLKLLDQTIKKIFVETNKNQIAYVTLVQLPNDFDIENPPGPSNTLPMYAGKIEYQYPENIKKVNNSGGELFISGNEKKYFEIGMKQYSNSNQYAIFQPIGVGFIMIYWVLFGIWATINAYHTKRLNVAWGIIFFVLNAVGYLLHKIYYWFKVDRVA